MPERVNWVSDDEWETIVSNVPIVSVDLVVLTPNGVVLGRRVNEPAKNRWFVPGGRVEKREHLDDAVHRIAQEELGAQVEIENRLGVYEHLYETADVSDAGGKHYVPVGFVVTTDKTKFNSDQQHADIHVFSPGELPDLHEYVTSYLRDADIIPR